MRIFCAFMVLLSSLCLVLNGKGVSDLPPGFDPYRALGVARDATQAQIRRAFRALSLKNHPDKAEPAADGPSFQEIALGKWFVGRVPLPRSFSAAYEVLGDGTKRQMYDSFGGKTFQSRWEFEQAGGSSGQGFYGKHDVVRSLHPRDLMTDDLLVVKFYAPWCVHCQNLAPELKRAALLLEDKAEVGALDCDAYPDTCQRHSVAGFPTLRAVLPRGGGVDEYRGPHTAEGIEEWVNSLVTDPVRTVTVIELQERFRRPTGKGLLLDFSVPQCQPCHAFRAAFRAAAASLGGTVDFWLANCDQPGARGVCDAVRVPYFPYLVFFPSHASSFEDGVVLTTPELARATPAEGALRVATSLLSAMLPVPEEMQPE
jgi:thiol-disulfide isomerase/thioredoxin